MTDRDRETLEQFLRGEIPKPFEAFYFTKAIRSLLERDQRWADTVREVKAAVAHEYTLGAHGMALACNQILNRMGEKP